jgi:hypothetical protein
VVRVGAACAWVYMRFTNTLSRLRGEREISKEELVLEEKDGASIYPPYLVGKYHLAAKW